MLQTCKIEPKVLTRSWVDRDKVLIRLKMVLEIKLEQIFKPAGYMKQIITTVSANQTHICSPKWMFYKLRFFYDVLSRNKRLPEATMEQQNLLSKAVDSRSPELLFVFA